ncbi:hypothetical protein LCGC14_2496010, partial [marine sediment metagenome]
MLIYAQRGIKEEDMKFTGQRKLVMDHLVAANGWKEDRLIVADITATGATFPLKSFRTVASGLKKDGFLNHKQEGQANFWVITDDGIKAMQEGGSTSSSEAQSPEQTSEEEDEEIFPKTAEELAREERIRQSLEQKAKEEAEITAKKAEQEAEQLKAKQAEERKQLETKQAEERKRAEETELVEKRRREEKGEAGRIEEHPRESLLYSREGLGLTPFQIFMRIGQEMGGLTDAKVRGITDVVWAHNPENLDNVWT